MSFNSINRICSRIVLSLAGEKYRSFIILYSKWRDIVGDLLAERSHPIKFQKSILYVGVQNNSWMQELILHKQTLLVQCRQYINEELTDIIFVIRS
ncbi:MAG: DciA family protein [Candidatus Cloacimonadaceae bacterium]|nr:DciA family protein [Candidatus Cloacimonadaceae bacterium]MDP3115453.1 DciA family protein [Candidatus Cloacimonadaceae bacterium]